MTAQMRRLLQHLQAKLQETGVASCQMLCSEPIRTHPGQYQSDSDGEAFQNAPVRRLLNRVHLNSTGGPQVATKGSGWHQSAKRQPRCRVIQYRLHKDFGPKMSKLLWAPAR